MWNDPAIRELNPDIVDKLPAQKIITGYSTSSTALSFPEVFKLTLESFSSEFKEQFAAVNRSFTLLPPALRGDAQNAGGSSAARSAWLQVRTLLPLLLSDHVSNNSRSRHSMHTEHPLRLDVPQLCRDLWKLLSRAHV
jgi:hypothetical protein